MTSGYTTELGEQDKHWVCVPLVVEVFGGCGGIWWLSSAQEALSRVAKKLAIRIRRFWPEVSASIYCCLGITRMHQYASTSCEVDISLLFSFL